MRHYVAVFVHILAEEKKKDVVIGPRCEGLSFPSMAIFHVLIYSFIYSFIFTFS